MGSELAPQKADERAPQPSAAGQGAPEAAPPGPEQPAAPSGEGAAVPPEKAKEPERPAPQPPVQQAPPVAQAPPPPPPPPPAPRDRGTGWRWGCGCGLAGCLVLVVVVLLIGLVAVARTTGGEGLAVGRERIAVIRVDGLLVAGESGFSPLAGAATGSEDVVRQIERALDDPAARGILLRINSPGGSAAACQEIYHAIQEAHRRGKPVVASMADVAASGGYYIAAPAKEIWANPSTLTGSIGAIATHEDLSGLLAKVGVKAETLKAGRMKDMMSPYRALDPESRAVMERLLKETHERFIADVAQGRQGKLAEEAVRRLADGRVYSGLQAKEHRLIDQVGGMQEALQAAARLAGIPGRPATKEYAPRGLLRHLFGSSASQAKTPVALSGGLLYDPVAAWLAQGALAGAAAEEP